jgi:hypothetical protein
MEQNKNQALPWALNLMILKTLESADRFQLNQGRMYPALLLAAEEDNWRQISEILTRFLEPSGGSL